MPFTIVTFMAGHRVDKNSAVLCVIQFTQAWLVDISRRSLASKTILTWATRSRKFSCTMTRATDTGASASTGHGEQSSQPALR